MLIAMEKGRDKGKDEKRIKKEETVVVSQLIG